LIEQTYRFRYKPFSSREKREIKKRISTRCPHAGQRNLGSYLNEVEDLGIDRGRSFFRRARFKSESSKRTVLVSYPFFGLGFDLTVTDDEKASFNIKQLNDFITSGKYPEWYEEQNPEIIFIHNFD